MNDGFNTEIGKRIQDIRCHKGYSRDKLSERAGISAGFLGAIEKGSKGMSAQTLYGISRALNVTSDFILFGVDDSDARLDCATQVLVSMHGDEREAVQALLEKAADLVRGMDNSGK